MSHPSEQHLPVPLTIEQFEEFRGKWVALDAIGKQVLASANDLEALESHLEAAGLDPEKLVFDRIEDDDDGIVGGAGIG